MELYGKILLIAMPAFLILVIAEKIYGYLIGHDTAPLIDSVSSMSSGISNVVKDVLGLSVSIVTYEWLVGKVAVYHVESTVLAYVIAFITIDIYGYWTHRWSHRINFFWNRHVIHHSSEEFNLGCALRQTVSSFVNLFTILLLPAALLGVSSEVIAFAVPIHLFAQFWYHTRHINKMGFLEKIIVTPSHHRVHHAINPEYIDKNHGQILIIWDKLFGTFQEELPDVPPVYGITRPAGTWNPIRINYQHLWLMMKDAWRAKNWRDKIRLWYMPTGWRPADVEAKYPIPKIDDVYHFRKYGTNNNPMLVAWSMFQLLVTFSLVCYFFAHIAGIGSPHIFVYGFFIFLSIYSYTELMDQNVYSVLWEALRFAVGVAIISYYGDWFGMNTWISVSNYLMIGYFVLSFLVNVYFAVFEFQRRVLKPA